MNEYNGHAVALQIGDDEFLQCRSMIASYLQLYYNRPSKLPRLQLAWSISNRALRKMKPSTKVESSLPVIMEDEDDDDSSSSSDAGYFDRYFDNLWVLFFYIFYILAVFLLTQCRTLLLVYFLPLVAS